MGCAWSRDAVLDDVLDMHLDQQRVACLDMLFCWAKRVRKTQIGIAFWRCRIGRLDDFWNGHWKLVYFNFPRLDDTETTQIAARTMDRS